MTATVAPVVARQRSDLSTVSPLGRPPARALLVCLLLLISSVAWRKGTYYSGDLDVVVLSKAMLSLVALALAGTAPRQGTPWSRLPLGPIPWMALYLAVTTVGGILHGNGFATMVLGGRVCIITATAVLLVRAYPAAAILSALTSAMLLLAAFASLTGVGSLAATGRLYGGVPPLNANEIALLISVPLVCIMWRCVHRLATWRDVALILPALGVIWLTGTRTGLAALALAVIVLVLMAPRIPVPLFCSSVLAVPILLFVLLFTPLLTAYVTRGDTASVLTLNSRTVAWSAALHYADTLPAQVLGVGLAVKQIPVSAMYRNAQILDSTWVSAYVQSGVLGTALLAILVLATAGRVMASAPPMRSLSVALLVLLVGRSFLESGMFDASATYITFLFVALTVQRPCRQETP
ncbi:MAG: O-antigen ligase family protein [Actinomycetota bacterium]|nr:O-antigen ligase family protein [Actinomycetota bacterium]